MWWYKVWQDPVSELWIIQRLKAQGCEVVPIGEYPTIAVRTKEEILPYLI